MQKSALAILLTTTLALPLVGHAQESYVKLQVGKSDYRDVGESIRPAAFLLGVGMSLSKTWDVEAGYVRFGMAKTSDPTTTSRTQTQSLYVAGVGNFPITPSFSAYGKAGISLNRTTFDESSASVSITDSKVKPTILFGAGLSYQFTKELAGLIEYSHYGRVSDDSFNLSLATLGLRYSY